MSSPDRIFILEIMGRDTFLGKDGILRRIPSIRKRIDTYFGCRHCYDLTYKSCKEHDSRVSALMKMPPGQLENLLKSKDPKTTLLAAKAALKFFDKFKLFP